MMGATHRLGGAALGMLAAEVLTCPDDPAGKAVVISAAVLGSLIPDIDHPGSTISRRHRGIGRIAGVLQEVLRGIGTMLPQKQGKYLRTAAGHRGITHTLLMAILCTLAVHMSIFIIPGWKGMLFLAAWGIGAGMLSHLVLDMFAGGVPLFFPFIPGRITLAHIRTGGPAEWLVRVLAAALLVLLTGNEILRWI